MRHHGRWIPASALGLVLTLVVAAPMLATPMTPLTGGQERERDPGWLAPAEAAAKPNPLGNRPGAEAGGQKVFRQRCATCHGDDGRGTRRAPDLTQEDVQAQTDGALFWKISGGNSHQGMPAFSFLPEPQRWQL